MKLSTLLAPLIDAKVDHELIRQQILAFEAEQNDALEQRRRADAERQSRKRDRDQSRDVTLRHSDRSLTGGDAHVEDKTSNLEIEPQESKGSAPAKPTPRQRLLVVLDADHAEAVLDHRQRLRKPLTEHAAKLMALELAKFPNPNAAADRMIAKGWQSIDVTWPEASGLARAGPGGKAGVGSVFDELDRRMNDGQGHGSGDDKAPSGVVLSLPHRVAQ